ncbi:MAG: AEC family transporter [Kiritimatiellae bacterium]|nr:AEC family transporter [Kiritimatiellia bacterium]
MLIIAIQILAIFAMIGIGTWATRRQWFSKDFSTQLSLLLIRVFYPSLLFSAILRKYTLAELADKWILPAGAATIIGIGWCIGWVAKRTFVRHFKAPTRRAFHFACTMNNYSFLPIMIIAGTPLGEEGIAMVALTTIASDTLMWTLGFRTFTGKKLDLKSLPSVFLRPPILALCLAVCCLVLFHFFAITPETLSTCHFAKVTLNTLYTYLGSATIPASALICGMRLGQLRLTGLITYPQIMIAILRMVIIPAIILFLLALLPLPENYKLVFGIIALMPGAMVGVSMAEVYGGDIPFVSAMILNTHALCIITVPIGLWFLGVC